MHGQADRMREHAAAFFHQLARRSQIRWLRELGPGEHRVHHLFRLVHDLRRCHTRTNPADDRIPVFQHKSQQFALLRRILAAHRPHPGHVTRVVPVVRREVHQDQLAVVQFRHVPVVMRVPNVGRPRRRDRAVPLQPSPVHQEHVARRRIQFILRHPGFGTLHRLQNPLSGNLGRPPDQRDLARALHAPQFIQHRRQIRHLRPWESRRHHRRKLHLPRNPAVERIIQDRRVRRNQLVPALRPSLARRKQRVNRQRGLLAVGRQAEPVPRPHRFRRCNLVGTGQSLQLCPILFGKHAPLGCLQPAVARRHEQRRFPRPSVHQQIGMRRLQSAQVVEFVRLPRHVEAGSHGHTLHHRHRLVADLVVNLRPPGPEFLRRKIGLVPRLGLRLERRHAHE